MQAGVVGVFRSRFALGFVMLGAMLAGSLAVAQQSDPNADFVVSRPVMNMYKSASADTEVTSQVLYGTGVKSLEKQGNWIKIRTADDYTGWVAAGDVRAESGASYASEGKSVRVTALSANAYRAFLKGPRHFLQGTARAKHRCRGGVTNGRAHRSCERFADHAIG